MISRLCILTWYQAELKTFHEAHFGESVVDNFSHSFLPHDTQFHQTLPELEDDDGYEDEEDDGLGYYRDGVKRTLTDEQIAMFRHSELEALRRAQESQSSNKTAYTTKPTDFTSDHGSGDQLSDGELPAATKASATTKKKKRKRGKGRVEIDKPEKPDLRKRTWDVVETGLSSLDYGDKPQDSTAIAQHSQRRRISYDD